mmetsp:Transcript_84618/g.215423  ORF Transcript_84618/g.215423 Transcript_84618/m.215423 type:complete len:165 (-) Transcript_84618:733-1227(-)
MVAATSPGELAIEVEEGSIADAEASGVAPIGEPAPTVAGTDDPEAKASNRAEQHNEDAESPEVTLADKPSPEADHFAEDDSATPPAEELAEMLNADELGGDATAPGRSPPVGIPTPGICVAAKPRAMAKSSTELPTNIITDEANTAGGDEPYIGGKRGCGEQPA